ncbi:MAG: hypothetical protein LUD47_00175 [Clostridia bacterium]|nr:hypothetical protein [Clostridia bacterium]
MKIYKIRGDGGTCYLLATDNENRAMYRYDEKEGDDIAAMTKDTLRYGYGTTMGLDNWKKRTAEEYLKEHRDCGTIDCAWYWFKKREILEKNVLVMWSGVL